MGGKEIERERFERIRWLIFFIVSIFYSCKNLKGKLVYILHPFSSSYLLNKELFSFHLLLFSCYFPSSSFSSFSPILISKHIPTYHLAFISKINSWWRRYLRKMRLMYGLNRPITQISSIWISYLKVISPRDGLSFMLIVYYSQV